MKALRTILTSPQCGDCFDPCEEHLRIICSDKSSDTRKQVYTLISDCLQAFTYPDLKKYESKLVLLLLSGLSEEKEDLRKLVVQMFDKCGESRKKLAEKMEGESLIG